MANKQSEKAKKANETKRMFFQEAIKRAEKQMNDQKTFESWSAMELEERIECLRNNYGKFQTHDLNIRCEEDLDAEKMKKLSEEAEAMESLCIKLKTKLKVQIEALKNKEEKRHESMQKCENASPVGNAPQVARIPEEWGTFDGNFGGWHAFHKKFDKAVNKNVIFSAEEKFAFLKRACVGPMVDTYQTFNLDTYDKAWKKLNEIFGSPYKQAMHFMKKLSAIEHVEHMSNEAMRKFLKEVFECEAGLKIAFSNEAMDAIMVFSIINKLDEATLRIWERHRAALAASWAQDGETSTETRAPMNYMPTWNVLREFLQSEAEIYFNEQAQAYAANPKSKASVSGHQKQDQQKAGNTSGDDKANAPGFLQCDLCDGVHPKYKCKVYLEMSLSDRLLNVQEQSLCVKCLRKKHQGGCADPRSNQSCPKCAPQALYHNSSLCPKQVNQAETRTTSMDSWDD